MTDDPETAMPAPAAANPPNGAEPAPSETGAFRPYVILQARRILAQDNPIHALDPDHYDVVSLRTPSRRVRVYRLGDVWRCRVDRENNQDQPCSHILAVLAHLGIVALPNTAESVWSKGKEGRDQSVEGEAWTRVPTRVPELLADLLRTGLPALAPEPARVASRRGGRPTKPLYPQVYQAILRVAYRQNLHAARGLMQNPTHRHHNPYGGVGIATLSRFLSRPETTTVLEKLLALTTTPVRPYESLLHPDGTGLTEQHFSAYFDERYMRRKKDEKKEQEQEKRNFVGPPAPTKKRTGEPRLHHWTCAEILWTYRYTLIAALYTQQGPFGEAPWLIPLLERARLTLDAKEVGGDKAYDAEYLFEYARRNGLDAQFKTRDMGARSHRSPARKRAADAAERDPLGFAAKANRRNNAETGNHAFKAILGDQVYSKNARAQRNEILCMAIAYNLTRLVYLEVERGIRVEFGEGARALAAARWVLLDELRKTVPSRAKVRPEWT